MRPDGHLGSALPARRTPDVTPARARRQMLIGAVVVLAFRPSSRAVAQADLYAVSQNRKTIGIQLRRAIDLGQQSLKALAQLGQDDSLEPVRGTMNSVYVLIRAAREGLELNLQGKKLRDPVDDLLLKRVTTAWNLTRGPVDDASSAMPRQQYIDRCIRSMTAAIDVLRQIEPLLP
jgi:hypothetical protein